jgi:hypothetical protein
LEEKERGKRKATILIGGIVKVHVGNGFKFENHAAIEIELLLKDIREWNKGIGMSRDRAILQKRIPSVLVRCVAICERFLEK